MGEWSSGRLYTQRSVRKGLGPHPRSQRSPEMPSLHFAPVEEVRPGLQPSLRASEVPKPPRLLSFPLLSVPLSLFPKAVFLVIIEVFIFKGELLGMPM